MNLHVFLRDLQTCMYIFVVLNEEIGSEAYSCLCTLACGPPLLPVHKGWSVFIYIY